VSTGRGRRDCCRRRATECRRAIRAADGEEAEVARTSLSMRGNTAFPIAFIQHAVFPQTAAKRATTTAIEGRSNPPALTSANSTVAPFRAAVLLSRNAEPREIQRPPRNQTRHEPTIASGYSGPLTSLANCSCSSACSMSPAVIEAVVAVSRPMRASEQLPARDSSGPPSGAPQVISRRSSRCPRRIAFNGTNGQIANRSRPWAAEDLSGLWPAGSADPASISMATAQNRRLHGR